jgi:hypothetical protein
MFLWKDRGSDFSEGPMKLRRTYLVANEEYKNEQLTRALFTYLGVVNSFRRVASANALLADTGAAQSRHLGQLIPFGFFAGVRQGSLGFWKFFGPIVLAMIARPPANQDGPDLASFHPSA